MHIIVKLNFKVANIMQYQEFLHSHAGQSTIKVNVEERALLLTSWHLVTLKV